MRYIKIVYYVWSIRRQTGLPVGKIIVNAMNNTGFSLENITDGWLWSVLERYEDKCK